MTQPEQLPEPEEMRKMFRGMQVRMRNYALHYHNRIGPRTFVALRDLNLLEHQADPIGSEVDLDVLRNAEHPRIEKLPSGPLLLYHATGDASELIVVEPHMLLLSQIPEVRKAALSRIERMVAEGSFEVTPKTKDALKKTTEALMSDAPSEWRPAPILLSDAFSDDILVALQGVRQSLQSDPVIPDSIRTYALRLFYPSISSLDSITLAVRNPEKEQPRLMEVIASVVGEAESLRDACARYYVRLGYIPLAPGYAMSEVVTRWLAAHSDVDAWKEVWDWAEGAFGPVPRYHACCVFVMRPDLIPEGKLADLWREILNVLHESDRKGGEPTVHESWAFRLDLARHFAFHLEAHLPENDSAGIACLAWWLAERTASLFPDQPSSAAFYQKNWVMPATARSAHVWPAAFSRMGASYLRYITQAVNSPWATSLLALMGTNLEHLAPQDQPVETQGRFHEVLVSCLVRSLPFADELPATPTYAMEYPLGVTALKWGACLPEERRKPLVSIVAASRNMRSVELLCKALRGIAEKPLVDQVAIALALRSHAYNNPTVAAGVWEVLSDAEWRLRVLVSVEEQVAGLLMETFLILQAQNQDKWFFLLPHYLVEACEKAETEERRRLLFLHVINTSLVSETVSAIRRLLRGEQKTRFIPFAKEFREHAEELWSSYPPWVQGRLRGLLASLRAV